MDDDYQLEYYRIPYICHSLILKKRISMKKFLALVSIVCFVAFVSNAQEPQKKATQTETAVDASAKAVGEEAPAATKKACCSSKKGAKACSAAEKAACDHSGKAKGKADCNHGGKAKAEADVKSDEVAPNNK
jgi:heat shock protein HslJ